MAARCHRIRGLHPRRVLVLAPEATWQQSLLTPRWPGKRGAVAPLLSLSAIVAGAAQPVATRLPVPAWLAPGAKPLGVRGPRVGWGAAPGPVLWERAGRVCRGTLPSAGRRGQRVGIQLAPRSSLRLEETQVPKETRRRLGPREQPGRPSSPASPGQWGWRGPLHLSRERL